MRSCVCRRGNKDGLRNTERLLAGRGIGDIDCSDLLVATIKMRLAVWKEAPRNLRNVICSGRFRHTRSENYCNCDDQQLPYSHRANPPNIFWSTIFVLTRFLHASRYPSRETLLKETPRAARRAGSARPIRNGRCVPGSAETAC